MYICVLNVGTPHEYWKNLKNVWSNTRPYLVLGSVACFILIEKQYIWRGWNHVPANKWEFWQFILVSVL